MKYCCISIIIIICYYFTNEKMKLDLGISTTTIVEEVKNREDYSTLLNKLAEKELKGITTLRNFRLLVSSIFLIIVILLIAITYLAKKRQRITEDFIAN
ncbi:hypothetical protein REL40_001013 [Listeria monocytogenes]|nr:hypothetical protein [Listeria monocytogenes]